MTINTHSISSDLEAEQLIAILRAWGVTYLSGGDVPVSTLDSGRDQQSASALIQRLAQCSYPRVRDATISLFLLHPELANSVLVALRTSQSAVAEQIALLTLAALYLQRKWSIRLALAFGHPPCFPEDPFTSLWVSRHLPPPAFHNGEWGLQALQAYAQQQSGLPLNYLGDWQNQIDHLLLQEEAHHRRPCTLDAWPVADDSQWQQEYDMSMRPDVDKQQIETFLKNLGRTFRKPGRLYLVGGAAMVHAGLRAGSTQDIDVEVRAADEDEMLEAIRRLKDALNINIEFASPADFMPLPSQWEMNARYIGRYGTIDVFYFDFYSIALSKIQRGTTRDINDVKLLLQRNIITLHDLDAAYHEVLPRVGKRPYNRLDPAQFAARYTTVRQLLSSSL